MPHILVTKHNQIDTPSKNIDGVVFNYIAKSDYENKISVSCDGKEFFLTQIPKNENCLIKVDSTTRVTPIDIAKKALKIYSSLIDGDILFSNITTNKQKVEPQKEYLKDISYFVNDFKTDKKIAVEVGFGSGRHLLYQAQQNPDTVYIGLEIHTPSIEAMLKQVKLQNITNIYAVNYDARLFLEFLDSNSVGQIFVHFPVPWDKKPHRRVMSKEFIEESMRVLDVGGTLELRTDSVKYYQYNLELLEFFKEYKSTIVKNQDLQISSKYEDRWKRQGKDIWDITIYSKDISNPIVLDKNFFFDDLVIDDLEKLIQNLPSKPIVKEGFFVHFEHTYKINSNYWLLHLTMGSFNKPLSKYLVIENKTIKYFQNNPIPTSANHKAHNLIKTIFDEVTQ